MTGSKSGGAAKGYLYRLLADGSRPFRYRSRVRALLGFPECGGIEMNFSNPLPIAGFSYVPRFRGEFEFPDDLVAAGSLPVVHAEDIASSAMRASAILPQGEPARGRSAADPPSAPRTMHAREGMIEEQRRPAPRLADDPSREIWSGKTARGGNRVRTAPVQTAPVQTVPAPTAPGPAESRIGPTLQAHDVVLPGIQARPDPAAHSREDHIREPKPANPMLPAFSERAASYATAKPRLPDASTRENRSKTVDAAPARPAGIPAAHGPRGGLSPIHASGRVAPERPFPEEHVVQRSSSQAPPDPPPARSEPPRVRTGSRSILPPHLHAETVATLGRLEQTMWDAASMPSMRRPNRAGHPGKTAETHQPSSAPASNPVPVAPAAQTPAIVVQPVYGPGAASPAFWERRHLTNLRLRIRR